MTSSPPRFSGNQLNISETMPAWKAEAFHADMVWLTFNWFPLNRGGEDAITLFLFFLDVAPLPINCSTITAGHKLDTAPLPINCNLIISIHKLDLAPLPIYCSAIISGHKLDMAPLPIYCSAIISGHKLDMAPLPINCILIISGHKWDLALLPIYCSAIISGQKLDPSGHGPDRDHLKPPTLSYLWVHFGSKIFCILFSVLASDYYRTESTENFYTLCTIDTIAGSSYY